MIRKTAQENDRSFALLHRYDEEEGAWVLLESEVDTDLKVVSARVEQFSIVGLLVR